MKLWLDDVRRAPEGWAWARTNDEAKELLLSNEVTHCSLDHDLGLHDLDIDAGEHEDWDKVIEISNALGRHKHGETGYDLVNWMIENKRVPEHITIHSWNPAGAQNMAARFTYFGYDCTIAPFRP